MCPFFCSHCSLCSHRSHWSHCSHRSHWSHCSHRSHCSRCSHCSAKIKKFHWLTHSLNQWVTRSPIELSWTAKKTWPKMLVIGGEKNMGPKCFKIIELFNHLSFVSMSMSRAGWPWFLAVGSCPDYTRSLVTACHPTPKMHHGMIGPGPSWVQSLTIHKQRQLVELCLYVPLSQSWVSKWGALFSTNMTS